VYLAKHNRISDHYNFSQIILKAAGPAAGALRGELTSALAIDFAAY
jgi:hypothetical protein